MRKVPKLASQGSVLFEAGTISTRAGSFEDSPIIEDAEEGESSDGSPNSSNDGSYPATREFLRHLTEERGRCPLPSTLSSGTPLSQSLDPRRDRCR